MDPDQLEELEAAVRTDLIEERGTCDDLGFELLVRARVDALIAQDLDLSRAAFRRRSAESAEAQRKA